LGITEPREADGEKSGLAHMTKNESRWVARVTPMLNFSVDSLLEMPLGLDVWERYDEFLVVAASDFQLSELERRRLARVEKLYTIAEFQSRALQRPR
jgi:hypothetical protein